MNAFKIEETGEIALVKGNGTIEFWTADRARMTDCLDFKTESAALAYVRGRGWKEVPVAV